MLTGAMLLRGYANGVFPMAYAADDPQLYWFDPPRRGILPVGGVHASRSLRRSLARDDWTADATPDFDAIVAACADRAETWINAPLRRLYRDLHAAGHAQALAVACNGKLAGGIFGITLGSAFFGESMFSARTNGSKMALVWISDHLARCGFRLFDTQYLTPHLASMGGIEISRRQYRARLAEALAQPADFHAQSLRSAECLLASLRQPPSFAPSPSPSSPMSLSSSTGASSPSGPIPSPPSGSAVSGS